MHSSSKGTPYTRAASSSVSKRAIRQPTQAILCLKNTETAAGWEDSTSATITWGEKPDSIMGESYSGNPFPSLRWSNDGVTRRSHRLGGAGPRQCSPDRGDSG